ncbi:MAG: hypothetical protein WCL14_01635 [Bacteroidota bacterium]
MKSFLFSCFFLLFMATCVGQSNRQYAKAGNESFSKGDYPTAAQYYRLILDNDSTMIDIGYKYAEACRLSSDFKNAERWYSIVNAKDKGVTYHNCAFWLGMMKKDAGKYKEARRLFERFVKKQKKNDNYYTKKAKNEIASCDSAMRLYGDSVNVLIKHLDNKVNTVNSEFAAFPIGDSLLYFSSFRPDVLDSNELSSRIFLTNKDSGDWALAKQLDTIINSPEYHDGNVCFSGDYKRFYYTRCESTSISKTRCEIWVRNYENDKWSSPKKLNDQINLKNFTATQPNIGVNEDGSEVLYFVSNRPGGKGRMDIWSCSVSKEGIYGNPVNLGDKINTFDDEISPFYHKATKTLYFSSNGHYGLGGFDVFKTKKDSMNNWMQIKNLGVPYNTRFNDLYFALNERGDNGFLTSNRTGSFFKKNENCCDDIYAFTLPVKDSIIPPKKKTIEQEIKLLVPLTLFFHNDEPDNNTLDTITKKSYKTTYDAYISMIEKYKNEYAKGLKGDEKIDAEEDISNFFEDSVIFGFNQLEKFGELLEKNLDKGNECIVTLKGYCSPLASTDYNIHLAKRRVSCLRNYFNEYKDGAFRKYMNGADALLKFEEENIGELMADASISDNPNDLRNSVYSRKAAKERKIQIIAISTGKKN